MSTVLSKKYLCHFHQHNCLSSYLQQLFEENIQVLPSVSSISNIKGIIFFAFDSSIYSPTKANAFTIQQQVFSFFLCNKRKIILRKTSSCFFSFRYLSAFLFPPLVPEIFFTISYFGGSFLN